MLDKCQIFPNKLQKKTFLSFSVMIYTLVGLSFESITNKVQAKTKVTYPLRIERDVQHQPFVAATKRLIQALDYIGSPLNDSELKQLNQAFKHENPLKSVTQIQKVLDAHCLFGIRIETSEQVSILPGPVQKELVQQGWRSFLVKVFNREEVSTKLILESPNALGIFKRGAGRGGRQRPSEQLKDPVTPSQVAERFLDIADYEKPPLKVNLSSLNVEYRIIHLYCRDVGFRTATFSARTSSGKSLNSIEVKFQSVPAVEVSLKIQDVDQQPTTAAFLIRDQLGRVYPNPARRLAPDFFFHKQVYRSNGESVHLPAGKYTIQVSRGPEYLVQTKHVTIPSGIVSHRLEFQLKRWIHAAKRHWYSGDHHIHAAGCKHYDSPTEGVTPAAMMRHILGEDLNVGCVLSWGPCWYNQKQYFEGKTSSLSHPDYLMRYDVEVSGFPSSHAGHLCLLGLSEDDYPGTKTLEDWPSWTLPVLQWAKKQQGVVGYAHSGNGLHLPRISQLRNTEGKLLSGLPDYRVPKFNGIGANEYIVTVAHDACDFISTADTPAPYELNIWYHTLNCGFRARISGETDFPCIYGERVGKGRSYVKLKADQPLNFKNWVAGIKAGRSYCGDGFSHVFDFKVDQVSLGEPGSAGKISQLNLEKPQLVTVSFDVAAFLPKQQTERLKKIQQGRLSKKPYWHLEKARIKQTRQVPVEVILNGHPVAAQDIVADGTVQKLTFKIDIKHSSWIAIRILPSVHTNPIFVEVDGKPIRASKKSATWCQQAVQACWKSKKDKIRAEELPAAKAAYDQALKIYEKVFQEALVD